MKWGKKKKKGLYCYGLTEAIDGNWKVRVEEDGGINRLGSPKNFLHIPTKGWG